MDIEKIIEQLDRKNLAIDEIETTLSMTGDNRDVWRVWTNDLVWIRRFVKKGATLVSHDKWGVAFDLETSQVRIFQPMSDKQRQKLASNLITE